jgi:hypothetical protein
MLTNEQFRFPGHASYRILKRPTKVWVNVSLSHAVSLALADFTKTAWANLISPSHKQPNSSSNHHNGSCPPYYIRSEAIYLISHNFLIV